MLLLVMSKKSGQGATTLAYNLSKLLELPLHVQESSFLHQINDDHIKYMESYKESEEELAKNVDKSISIELPINLKKITGRIPRGVVDFGSNYTDNQNNNRLELLLQKTNAVIIPVELGYESLRQTIETIKDLRGWNKEFSNTIRKDTPIVIVINKLDQNDGPKDFTAKKQFVEEFKKINNEFEEEYGEALIKFTAPNYYDGDEDNPKLPSFINDSGITLTYLRHSYALCGITGSIYGKDKEEVFSYRLQDGKYFLDMFKYKNKLLKSDTGLNTFVIDPNDKRLSYLNFKRNFMHPFEKFDLNFFRYLLFLTIRHKKEEYYDEKLYIAEKDFVRFRKKFLKNFVNEDDELLYIDERFNKKPYNEDALEKYKKLIKDFGFIIYAIMKPKVYKSDEIEPFLDSKEKRFNL